MTEETLGEMAIEQGKKNERKRERSEAEGRQELAEMSELQEAKGKKDRGKIITLH